MRSSTTPPDSSQDSVYWAWPGSMRPRSLLRQELTKAAAPGPRTEALPRCETSKMPTACRTAACSFSTPPSGYSMGISHPPKSDSFAPRAWWRAYRGERRRSVTPATLLGWPRSFPRAEGVPVSSIKLSATAASTLTGDALVVGLAQDEAGPVLVATADVARALRGLRAVWAQLGATGAPDEVVTVPAPAGVAATTVVATGLGRAGRRYEPEALRRAAGAAARSLAGRSTVVLALPARTPGEIEAVAQGALLGAYSFHRFRGVSAAKAKPGVKAFVLATDTAADRAAKAALSHAQVVADAITMTRDWVNTPPSSLYPQLFADAAAAAAKAAGLEVTVLDEKALKKGGYGGILGVGQGSAHPPRLVRIAYRHPKATKHLALVGKGITFDTGGISIKPAQGMEAMKSDMAGAAAVIATVIAAARSKAVVNVTAWAPMAENMPGGNAQRPSDVISIFGGRTVEVLNTDAEGRLILADALVAATAEEPDVVVDIATLTGAQVVALGARTSASWPTTTACSSRCTTRRSGPAR